MPYTPQKRITSSHTRKHIHQKYYASTPPRGHSQHLHKSLRETNILTYSGTTSNIRTSLHSYTTRTPSHTRNIYLIDTDNLYTDYYHTRLILQRHIVTDSSTHTPETLYTHSSTWRITSSLPSQQTHQRYMPSTLRRGKHTHYLVFDGETDLSQIYGIYSWRRRRTSSLPPQQVHQRYYASSLRRGTHTH